jgi:hypothetical protein
MNGKRSGTSELEEGLGIIAAEVPLAIGVELNNISEFTSYDELCMWNRVLSDKEIASLYNNGHGLALPKGDADGDADKE